MIFCGELAVNVTGDPSHIVWFCTLMLTEGVMDCAEIVTVFDQTEALVTQPAFDVT